MSQPNDDKPNQDKNEQMRLSNPFSLPKTQSHGIIDMPKLSEFVKIDKIQIGQKKESNDANIEKANQKGALNVMFDSSCSISGSLGDHVERSNSLKKRNCEGIF